jgi:hypothetical protein
LARLYFFFFFFFFFFGFENAIRPLKELSFALPMDPVSNWYERALGIACYGLFWMPTYEWRC